MAARPKRCKKGNPRSLFRWLELELAYLTSNYFERIALPEGWIFLCFELSLCWALGRGSKLPRIRHTISVEFIYDSFHSGSCSLFLVNAFRKHLRSFPFFHPVIDWLRIEKSPSPISIFSLASLAKKSFGSRFRSCSLLRL